MKSNKQVTQRVFQHQKAPLCSLDEGKLKGLRHRTVIDASNGAHFLAIWQEEHLPGFEVPLHLHDCEEIISVIEGAIQIQIGEEVYQVGAEESVVIPAWAPHGFFITSSIPVRLLAIFGSANPGIYKIDGTQSLPPWEGGDKHQFDEVEVS